MTRSTDLDRQLSDWLQEDGATVLRREVLHGAVADARRKSQVRPWGLPTLPRLRQPLVWAALLGVLVGLSLIVGLLGASPPTVRPSPSLRSFSVTGSLTVPRGEHSATLLKDGHVLISGGSYLDANGNVIVLDSAELYDPATGSFTPTGSMISQRAGATLTLLNDGRVLVAGGLNADSEPLDTAELYDPASGTFVSAGVMTIPRSRHTATLLQDGRVLIAGGDNGNFPLAIAELYDPRTGTFTRTEQPMTVAREWHMATRMLDGRVFIAGGDDAGGRLDARSAELYDPASGTFAQVARPNADCCGDHALLLHDGTVLTGAWDPSSPLVLRFDPVVGSFAYTGPRPVLRNYAAWTLLNDGRVLITGGREFTSTHPCTPLLATTEIYDPATGTFAEGPVMTRPRAGHSATLLADGTVLVAGSGCDHAADLTETAEVLR